ncbi:MAG: hypothetical protein H7145_22825 [Akkermansiaceae bacterium]|nr:hypothetical protein [Armatimonadota bacterium]
MVFLGGPRQAAGRRHIFSHAATCATLLFAGAVMLSGCGGGGGGETNPNPTPTPISTATVRGRIVENNTGGNVRDAVIRLGDVAVTTGDNGEFSIQIPGGGGERRLLVILPAGQYDSQGSYSESSCVRLASDGIVIEAGELENGDLKNIGDIGVSSTLTSPPPPPCDL